MCKDLNIIEAAVLITIDRYKMNFHSKTSVMHKKNHHQYL